MRSGANARIAGRMRSRNASLKSAVPSPGESGALKMLPAPVSDGAPVPGKSGIWWVEA